MCIFGSYGGFGRFLATFWPVLTECSRVWSILREFSGFWIDCSSWSLCRGQLVLGGLGSLVAVGSGLRDEARVKKWWAKKYKTPRQRLLGNLFGGVLSKLKSLAKTSHCMCNKMLQGLPKMAWQGSLASKISQNHKHTRKQGYCFWALRMAGTKAALWSAKFLLRKVPNDTMRSKSICCVHSLMALFDS